MKQTSGPDGGAASPWEYSSDPDRLAQSTVLLVEDDRDIREMIGTLLDMAGLAFVACDTAESALNALREQEFDVVLTDYALPRRSGMWLLQEAESEGLIQGTPVLIVTAHSEVENPCGYEVIQKPFDLDELIERVRQRLEGTGTPRRRRASMPPPSGSGNMTGGPKCPEPIELILYVSSQSPRSVAAMKTIDKMLDRYRSSRFTLTVCSLPELPNPGAENAARVTPAAVRINSAGPRTLILGHITSPELLLELLADCEAERN